MKKLYTYIILLTIISCWQELSQEKIEFLTNQENAKNQVSNWIKNHAKYPESYEPISFSEFGEFTTMRKNKEVPNSKTFIIKHTHKILNIDSTLETFSGYFILNNDFQVNIIEVERSKSIGGAIPPLTKIWMDKFGIKLSAKDSIEQEKTRKEETNKIIQNLKEDLENGELEPIYPFDKEQIKNLLDTIDLNN